MSWVHTKLKRVHTRSIHKLLHKSLILSCGSIRSIRSMKNNPHGKKYSIRKSKISLFCKALKTSNMEPHRPHRPNGPIADNQRLISCFRMDLRMDLNYENPDHPSFWEVLWT